MGGKHSKNSKKDKNKNKWVPQPVNPIKYNMAAQKNYLYADLFVKKKNSEIQAKQADLERAMKLPVRYRDDEISRATSLVNDHKHLRAARIILKDCGVLRDLTHEVNAVQGDLSRLPNLLPYIETVIWGARRLNLIQLKDLEQMVLETLGPDVLNNIDQSPNIDQELRGLFASDKATPNELNDYWNMFSVQYRMPIDVINKAGHGVNTFTPTANAPVTNLVAAPLEPIERVKPKIDAHYSVEPSREKFLFGGLNAAPPKAQSPDGAENAPVSPPAKPTIQVPAIRVSAPGRTLQSPGKRDTGLTVEQPLSPFTLSTILRRADKILGENNIKTTDPAPDQFLTAPGRMSTQQDSMSMYPQQQQFISNGKASSHLGFWGPSGQATSGNTLSAAQILALEREKSKFTEQTVVVTQATVKRSTAKEIDCYAGNVQAPLMAIPSWLDLNLEPYDPEGAMLKSSKPINVPLQTKFSMESVGSFQQEEGFPQSEPVKPPIVDLSLLVDSMAFTTGATNT